MEDSRQGESHDYTSQASSTQGGFPISILMGFSSHAKGLLRAACGAAMIQDMQGRALRKGIGSARAQTEMEQKQRGLMQCGSLRLEFPLNRV